MDLFKKVRHPFGRKSGVNKVVLTLVYSDFLMLSASGFLAPIYAIFVTQQIKGATIATVGFVSMVSLVVKSAAQVPISAYVDSKRGELDDFRAMLFGSVIVSLVPLLYYFFAHEVWQLFALESLNGIGYAFCVPTWLAIYSRHLDKHKESTQWALHSNVVGMGMAVTAAVGGVLAERFGFRVLFLIISVMSFLGTALIPLIRDQMRLTDGGEGLVTALEAAEQKEKIII
jgi:MFS family permease